VRKFYPVLLVFSLFALLAVLRPPVSGEVIAIIRAPSAGGGGDYCDSCTPGDPTDIFCEDFEGTGYNCSWSETIGTGGSIDEDATIDSNFTCSDLGSEALEVSVGADANTTYTVHDTGSAYSVFKIKMYLVVTAANFGGTSQNEIVASLTSAAGTGDRMVDIYLNTDASSNLRFRFSYYYGSETAYSSTISTGTQYEIYISWDSGNNLTIDLNGTSVVNDNTPGSGTIRYVQIGRLFGASERSWTIQWAAMGADDDTEPSDCS